MREKQTRWNLLLVFLVAVTGNIVPVIRELHGVGWIVSEVSPHYFYLLVMSLLGFFIAFQIVRYMKIPKQTTSFYLSLLGVNFLINMVLILIYSVTVAIIY